MKEKIIYQSVYLHKIEKFRKTKTTLSNFKKVFRNRPNKN